MAPPFQILMEWFFYAFDVIMKPMKTIIKKMDVNQIDESIIREAGAILNAGGLVAFPTETVYGLGANALNEEAAQKTYEAKGRPSDNPLIIHIAKFEDLAKITVNVPPAAQKLADHFWPGPLTMIFEKSAIVPYGTTGGLDTVAVRMPDDEIALALIKAAGGYVSAPSANTSGRPSPTIAEHVIDDLNGKVEMILDSGSVNIGLESTIVDMTVIPPAILRPGAITADMLENVIGTVAVDDSVLGSESGVAPKAPGMKYRHYAPKAVMTIVEGELWQEVLAIRQLAYADVREGRSVGIIATSETISYYTNGIIKNIGARGNEKSIARNLYRILREFDEEDVEYIYSESFALQGMGNAIMNRLDKAAGHVRLSAASIVKQQKYRRIVFVSNTDVCRGPMAAELLRNQDLIQEYVIDSRGIIVLFPEPANQKAEAVMKAGGRTLEGHTSKAFSEADMGEDVLVLTMDESQRDKVCSEYPKQPNVYTLAEFVGSNEEIANPYGQPLTAYGACYEEIKMLIYLLAKKLNYLQEN